jgi:hypothetical protein
MNAIFRETLNQSGWLLDVGWGPLKQAQSSGLARATNALQRKFKLHRTVGNVNECLVCVPRVRILTSL